MRAIHANRPSANACCTLPARSSDSRAKATATATAGTITTTIANSVVSAAARPGAEAQ